MKKLLFAYRKFLIGLLLFSVITIGLFYRALKPAKQLPIFNPSDVNPELVDTTIQFISKSHRVAPFRFVNQDGKVVTEKDYAGKVYVADFFFTTCGSICPKMSKNMEVLQGEFLKDDRVKLLSHTVFPETDSVPVLKAYAAKHGVVSGKWNLVTGDKKEIYSMARKSYLAVKMGKPSELYDMVHTENFVLVDDKFRVRGFYDGTKIEEIGRLIEDIHFLLEGE